MQFHDGVIDKNLSRGRASLERRVIIQFGTCCVELSVGHHVEIYNSQERAGPGEIYFRIICNQYSILVKVEEIEEEEAREKKGS